MAGYTVYLDELLANNLIMNYAVLHLTAKLAGVPYRFLRLLSAALVGSLYFVAVFFPEAGNFYNLSGKFLVSILVVVVAFGFLPWRRFLGVWALFFGVSFAVGGVVYGINGLIADHGADGVAGYRYVLPGVVAALVLVAVLGKKGRILRRRIAEGFFRVPLAIQMGGKKVELEALLDTGNQLTDPVSRCPVVIVEYDSVCDFLPLELRKVLESSFEPDFTAIGTKIEDPKWATRLRLIPYRSLGKSGGLLVGFKPDAVEVVYGGRVVRVNRVVVGIYRQRLSPEAKYNALLHPRLVEALL
ncbi:MAG: sigma-E processing peptidase SpoIIGA [Ammonifex sp.]|jgi:stage II sporulation protein GA (sporulation sigma-E factor processing peptidase)|nr:MAG: sigma-E processing peptidase SpoIIGA [Ammonifex sp.]